MKHTDTNMQKCIDTCLDCYKACLETVTHCLTKGGKHATPQHIKSLLACAEICNTSAQFMLLGSEQHTEICEVCAETCDRCAESCERMGDDPQMKECAEACRQCAESCRKMSGRKAKVA